MRTLELARERLLWKLLRERGLARPVDTASSEYRRLRDEVESILQRSQSPSRNPMNEWVRDVLYRGIYSATKT